MNDSDVDASDNANCLIASDVTKNVKPATTAKKMMIIEKSRMKIRL